MKNRIAIVGGAGRLGRYIVNELTVTYDVVTLDRSTESANGIAKRVNILEIDELRRAFVDLDAVVHVAGIDGHVETSPDNFFGTNVVGTWNVLQAAFEVGVRKIVMTSSSSVSGLNMRPPGKILRYIPIDEDYPLHPGGTYGLTKQLNEVTGEFFGRLPGMQVICLRPSFVVFPELVPLLADLPLKFEGAIPAAFREPRPLLRTYVDPGDLARCYASALAFERPGFHLFWVNAGDTFEPTPTLDYLRSLYGTVPEVRKPEIFEANIHAAVIDCSRAAKDLGWTPKFAWPQILSDWRNRQR